ncbi:hypothetical protein [Ferruginibacter sp. SUN106]|uniref:hypothetical protein n=1 Tax=Ferruginibacter sp. SUN106 TaxID=2978348 RepID=UPI003D36C686
MKKLFLLAITAGALFTSCKKNDEKAAGIYKGPETAVYHGKAWTWIQLNNDGNPERMALSIDDAALNSVAVGTGTTGGEHHHDNNVVLKFHPKAAATIFNYVGLDWNPDGHPPVGIYDKPHFDFHFYMASPEETATYLDPVKLDASLPADYLPANYIGVDPVPAMGKHYVDVTSPELNGQLFTQTFIYGSYDAKLKFLEPMITLDFLKATTSFERAVPQPAKYQKAGYYPTRMRIEKSNGVTNIILEGFVLRQAS